MTSKRFRLVVGILTVVATITLGAGRSAIAKSACPHNLTLEVAATGDPGSANGTEAYPYRTITAALRQARAIRSLPCSQPITIQVAPGTYKGTNLAGTPTLETLPILLDVSDLTLLGSTTLSTDSRGLPTGKTSSATILEPDPTLTGQVGQLPALILAAPTGPTVHDVAVSGFALFGTSEGVVVQADLAIDRIQRFTVQGNVINGGYQALATQGSSGLVAANYVTAGGGPGIALAGGTDSFPANITVQANRSTLNSEGGLIVSAVSDVAFPTVPGVEVNTAGFNAIKAAVTNNDLSGHAGSSSAQPGFGIRLMDSLPGQSDLIGPTHITVDASDNTLDHDALGVAIDAGFPFRADPIGYVGTVTATFTGNAITNAGTAPAVVTFNRYTASLCAKELLAWQYLHDSTYAINNSTGELGLAQPSRSGAVIDNPARDPLDGHALRNKLTVNGVLQPSTTSALEAAISSSPTCQ